MDKKPKSKYQEIKPTFTFVDQKPKSKYQEIKPTFTFVDKKPKVVIIDDTKPIPPPPQFRDSKPKKSVKSMVADYEKNIILPPSQFRDSKPKKSVKSMAADYEQNIILPPLKFIDDYKPTPTPSTEKPTPKTKKEEVAFNLLIGYHGIKIIDKKDPLVQLQKTRKTAASHITSKLTSTKGLKFNETLIVTFEKPLKENDQDHIGETNEWGLSVITKTAYFTSPPKTIINNTEINKSLEETQENILKRISIWMSEGSGWSIKSLDEHILNVVKYKPMKGSSYIKLPEELRNSSKGLINMKNEDNECFRWCHIRHLNPQAKDPQKIKKVDKKYIENLNYSGIEFPVTTKQYNKIEKQNEININVFGYEDKQPYPIYVSKEKYGDCLNLLLITENENKHYVLIKNFNAFMYNQTKHKERKHFCMHCLQCFSSERVLTNHKENCIQINGKQAIKMPTKGDNILKFNNFHKQLPVPFVIYADFEAITEKIQGCQRYNDKSYTEAYQKHTDCGYGYKVVCCYDDKYTKPEQIYRGEKAVYKFMEAMLYEVNYCKKVIEKEFNKPLRMTKEDEDKFQKADECHICNKKI